MEFFRSENGTLTLLVAATLAMVAVIAFSLCNAVHNITFTP